MDSVANNSQQQQGAMVPAAQSTDLLAPGRSTVPVRLGIAPQSLDEAWRLAQNMAKSLLVPKDFQEKPHDVLVAIQLGMEVGLPPMQSLQSIAVINGRPSIWGDGFLALIMASEKYEDHDEYYEVNGERRTGFTATDWAKDDNAAVCSFTRRGKATPVVQRFTVAMAKKAGLLGKKGPWETYPDRMLKMRARSWAGRDAFPDVLRGLTTVEEAQDIPMDPPPQPARVLPSPQRLSNRTAVESTPSSPVTGADASRGAPVGDPVEPSGGNSAMAAPAAGAEPPPVVGVLIKDVVVTKGDGGAKAVITDERGQVYVSDDRGIVLSAQVAKDKGYYMEISSVRKGDESVIEEINKARTPDASGK